MFKTINNGKLPTRATKYSAGIDVYSNENIVICAGKTEIIGLGICLDMEAFQKNNMFHTGTFDENMKFVSNGFSVEVYEHFIKTHYLQLSLRSSLGARGLILPNGVGIIDVDYKDEIKMIIHNPSQTYDEVKIKRGDRIGQLILLEHKSHFFRIKSDVERNGGFGSTGR